jgi:ATP-dependent Lon protease
VSEAAEQLADGDRLEIDALQRNIKTNFQQIVSLSPLMSDDLQTLALNIAEPGRLADFIASSLSTIGTTIKQEVLATLDVRARLDLLNRILIKELEVLELGSKIQSQVQSEVGKNQRDYFLREQLKAIQRELGEGDDQTKEIDELREKIDAAGMPELVLKEARRELDRLSKMPPAAAEYTVSRTYLDWLVALPWAKRTDEVIDLPRTKAVLDADHSGLEKAKDRILEYLAVRKLNPASRDRFSALSARPAWARPRWRAPSRSRSAANSCASPRRRARRGRDSRPSPHLHRRAARPGSSRGSGAPSRRTRCSSWTRSTSWADFRGDPSSALLEVLDPEQNSTFRDHYLDVPFDLSEVLFITTANVLDTIAAGPLRDRMEVLELPGYTEEEKLAIAREHLVGKQVQNHGLTPKQIVFTDAGLRT